MSQSPDIDKNKDTFLSRIFGMNSMYNQLDVYEDYYQSSADLETQADISSVSAKSKKKPLVESESDYDEDDDDDEEDSAIHPDDPKSAISSSQREREFGFDEEDEEDFNPDSLLLNNLDANGSTIRKPPPIDLQNTGSVRFESTDSPIPAKHNLLTLDNIKKNIPKSISNNINRIQNLRIPSVTGEMPQLSFKKPPDVLPSDERIHTSTRRNFAKPVINSRERALWLWANIENLDMFLSDLYEYYLGNGYICILLKRVTDLMILIFVVGFSTYLSSCIDWSLLPQSKTLGEVRIEKCYSHMSGGKKFLLFLFYCYLVLRIVQLYNEKWKWAEIKNFYNNLLGITDDELQTISWQLIVSKIMVLKNQNAVTSQASGNRKHQTTSDLKSKARIDAHDIANRIMRTENYMIALFNKNILDLSLPFLPTFLSRKRQVLTKTLEWNLNLCINGMVFNSQGQVKSDVLKEQNRHKLSEELRKRFFIAGVLNLVLSPILVIYFILLYFFRYFNEYKSKPSAISSRQYTPLAEWKLREFNELYHLFQRRLNLSVPAATNYVDQFPRERMVLIFKFVSFVSGSFAAVLGILSIVDPEMFFNFEITKDRTVLFYISVFGSIWALSRNALPEENLVFDPEASIRYLSQFTHYLPNEWEGKLHSEEVKNEFLKLFDLKVVILLNELMSLVLTPFVLWFNLSNNSEKIIDFYREFSVHIDGLGYVCTFAMFNFEKKNKNSLLNKKLRKDGLRDNYYHDDKMVKSYLYFLESYGQNESIPTPYLQANSHANLDNTNTANYNNHNTSNLANRVLRQRNIVNNAYPPNGNLSSSMYPMEGSMMNSKWMPKSHQDPASLNRNHNANTPMPSIYLDKGMSNLKGSNYNLHESNVLGESFQVNYKFDNNDDRLEEGDGGVIGLLTNFYKQSDIGR